jgi:CheY-like chemotaxis protein
MRSIRMLNDAKKSEIPPVALTAYARLEDRREAIRGGFQNHLCEAGRTGGAPRGRS